MKVDPNNIFAHRSFAGNLTKTVGLDRTVSMYQSAIELDPDNVETLDLGLEAKFFDSFYLRGGYQSLFNETAENGLTLGAGINYKILDIATFTIDYSYSDWGVLSYVNRFSIGISAY